jgi:predicted secreted Zn-dependent protease
MVLASIVVPVQADVTDKVVYSYYIVRAQPDQSIGNVLNKYSPFRHDSRILHAQTNWDVTWHYNWIEKPDGKCKMVQVSVELDSKIVLPTLVGATQAQQNQFNTYLLALKTHELGHVDFGKQAARAIDSGIIALPELANCKVLDAAANALGNQILDSYRQKEIQYDVDTDHGKTQGASIN